jgi:precorrin-6A synthase
VTVRVLVIGIGSGDPGHLTGEAVRALNDVDVFLVPDKGGDKHDLAALRRELCREVIDHDHYRMIEVPDPERGPDRERTAGQYRAGVAAWHEARARRYAEIIRSEVGTSGTVGFLVWGDPAFYDSTIRIVEAVRDHGLALDLTVIAGISSIQLLAARHQIVLNRIGSPIHITTGRRLVETYAATLGDVVVMLDGDLACAGLLEDHPDLQIFWGAQLGLPDEALISGPLAGVIDTIRARRQSIRATRGWVMDTYLLRPSAVDR